MYGVYRMRVVGGVNRACMSSWSGHGTACNLLHTYIYLSINDVLHSVCMKATRTDYAKGDRKERKHTRDYLPHRKQQIHRLHLRLGSGSRLTGRRLIRLLEREIVNKCIFVQQRVCDGENSGEFGVCG